MGMTAPSPAATQLETLRELIRAATQRLLGDTISVADDQWRAPSRLPDWTRGHVATHIARHADGRLQRQLLKPGPHFRRDLRLDDDRLCDTAAVAQHGERDLAGGSQVSNPRVNRHRLADVSAQFGESGV